MPLPLLAAKTFAPWTVTKKAGFFQITTKHYWIRARTGERACREVAAHMEKVMGQYSLIFEELYVKPKALVVVWTNYSEYLQYLGRLLGGKPEGTSGITTVRLIQDYPVIEMDTFEQPDLKKVLTHEGLHQFLLVHLGFLAPLWLNEGLATYFEKSQSSPQRAQKALDKVNRPNLLAWLINLGPEGFYKDADKTYPLACSLVTFLIRRDGKGKISKSFRKFMGDLRAGKSPIGSFKKRFGENLSKTQKAWISWVKGENRNAR